MNSRTKKIFGIGLSKTGTTSLARALDILGYKTKDYIGITKYIPGDLASVDLQEIDQIDAVTDTPIPSFYKELDAKYPHSKFILTVREKDAWLKSCKKQFKKRSPENANTAANQIFFDLYGCTAFEEEKFASGYNRFLNEVSDYFKNRKHDLLVINVCAGESWEKLCPFLNVSVPKVPFPKTNVTEIQWMNVTDIISIARQAGTDISKIYERASFLGQRDDDSNLPPNSLASSFRIMATIFEKAFRIEYNHDRHAFNRARKASYRKIITGLKKLNPAIPVLSKESHDIPYSQRKDWHHCWLIDPLAGSEEFIERNIDFTVNIALIEGGKPIFGVVYLPLKDTVYYAKGDLGSFKLEKSNEPIKLEPPDKENTKLSVVVNRNGFSHKTKQFIEDLGKEYRTIPAAGALKLCLVAEGKADIYPELEPTMEWTTAAAHAVVKFAGKKIFKYPSNEELTYNKEDLVNGPFVAQ